MVTALRRRQDWPLQLTACFEAAQGRPFVWGEHDCCLFAANCILAMTGVDLAAAFRGRYADEAGAAAILAEQGGVEAIATKALGDPRPVAYAQRGDVVMVQTEEGPALAVVAGAFAFAATLQGLAAVPMDRWLKAWKV